MFCRETHKKKELSVENLLFSRQKYTRKQFFPSFNCLGITCKNRIKKRKQFYPIQSNTLFLYSIYPTVSMVTKTQTNKRKTDFPPWIKQEKRIFHGSSKKHDVISLYWLSSRMLLHKEIDANDKCGNEKYGSA